MNENELRQLLNQNPQLVQGLLSGTGGQLANQEVQNLMSQGQQLGQQLAQNAQAGNQAAMQQAQAGNQAAAMASQQAAMNQQQKKQQALGLMMSLLPMGKWLGAAGKAIGIGGKK